MIGLGWIAYPCAIGSAWYFRKNEYAIAIIHAIIFVVLSSYKRPQKTIVMAIIAGIAFSVLCYMTIVWFNLFKFNYTRYVIPVWVPITWALIAYFVLDLQGLLK